MHLALFCRFIRGGNSWRVNNDCVIFLRWLVAIFCIVLYTGFRTKKSSVILLLIFSDITRNDFLIRYFFSCSLSTEANLPIIERTCNCLNLLAVTKSLTSFSFLFTPSFVAEIKQLKTSSMPLLVYLLISFLRIFFVKNFRF